MDLATSSETKLNTRNILLDVQTALDKVSDCPVIILDDNKLQRKPDFVLINLPDDEKEYHMNIIPTNRPGNDCHLHLFGDSFIQQFIPLLSSSAEESPTGLQMINHQHFPDINKNKKINTINGMFNLKRQ